MNGKQHSDLPELLRHRRITHYLERHIFIAKYHYIN